MDRKRALRIGARVLFFPVVGFAWPFMKQSVTLMKREASRRADETKELGELYKAARSRVTGNPLDGEGTDDAGQLDEVSGESFAEAVARRGIAVDRAYLTFLGRKRFALCVGLFFVLLGAVGLAHGRWEGLAPMLVGGGFSLEIAWLSEFRLWQIRGRRLSKAEGASVRDFWQDPGAWQRTLDPEWGYGLSNGERLYRRWLWVKRLGLLAVVGTVMRALAAVLLHQHVPWVVPAVIGTAAALVLLVEFRLTYLRHVLGRSVPVLGFLRPEIGACYEGSTR